MKNLFKASLVALAVTGAVNVQAATVVVDAANKLDVSYEGSINEAFITLPDATLTLGDEYTINDRLVFTVNGATVTSQASATLTSASGSVTTGKLESTDDNMVVFRVTFLADDGAGGTIPTTGEQFVLSGIQLSTDSVRGDMGNVSISFTGLLNDGETVIESGAAGTAITVSKQFGFSAAATADGAELDGVIDVESDRMNFTGSATSDMFGMTFTNDSTLDFAATAPTIDYVFDGGDEAINGVTLPNGMSGTAMTQNTTTGLWEATIPGMAFTAAMATVNVDGMTAISVGSHYIDADLSYTPANVNTVGTPSTMEEINLASDHEVGEWTLNGAQVYVPYFPVNFSGMTAGLVLTNEGDQTGEIDLVAFDSEGNEYGPVTLEDSIGAEEIVTISSAKIAELFDIHWSAATKLAITATINVKKDDVVGTGYIQKAGTGRQSLTTISK